MMRLYCIAWSPCGRPEDTALADVEAADTHSAVAKLRAQFAEPVDVHAAFPASDWSGLDMECGSAKHWRGTPG